MRSLHLHAFPALRGVEAERTYALRFSISMDFLNLTEPQLNPSGDSDGIYCRFSSR